MLNISGWLPERWQVGIHEYWVTILVNLVFVTVASAVSLPPPPQAPPGRPNRLTCGEMCPLTGGVFREHSLALSGSFTNPLDFLLSWNWTETLECLAGHTGRRSRLYDPTCSLFSPPSVPNGTLVDGQCNGQVCIVKLYYGRRRVSLAEAEEILAIVEAES